MTLRDVFGGDVIQHDGGNRNESQSIYRGDEFPAGSRSRKRAQDSVAVGGLGRMVLRCGDVILRPNHSASHLAAAQERQPLEQVHVLLVLQ